AAPDALAAGTFTAGLAARSDLGTALTVERHGQDPGRSSLPHPAWPREEIPVANSGIGDRTPQRRRDVLLDQQIGESLGAVLASEGNHDRRADGRTVRPAEGTTDRRLDGRTGRRQNGKRTGPARIVLI